MANSFPDRASAEAQKSWFRHDHTQGSLLISLGILALPLMGTSLVAGVLFQLADLKLISGLGDQAMTAVIVTNQSLRQLIMMFVIGASFGSQSLIARSIGEGKREVANHTAGQTMLLGLTISLILPVIGLLIPAQLLGFMNVSPTILEIGVPYVQLVFTLNFGFIFIVLFNSILNGAGDTTTPFMIAVIQTTVSLVAEWALIYGNLGLPAIGIRGVAIGLAVGQVTSMILIGRVLFAGTSRIHIRARHVRPNGQVIKEILKLAWPPGVQMLGGFLVTVFFIRIMGEFGDEAQAAYSIGLRLGMLGPMICFPLAGAVATLVGQALGAGKVKRAWRAIGVGLWVHASLMSILAILLFIFREPLLRSFTDNPNVIEIGSRMLIWQAGSFALMAFFFVFFRALQGAGDVFVPMMISILNSLLITVPLGLYFVYVLNWGPDGIFIAQFISLLIGTALTGAWLATGRWTRNVRTAQALLREALPVTPADPDASMAAAERYPNP